MSCKTILFADDTTLAVKHRSLENLIVLGDDILWREADLWFTANKLALINTKTQTICFSRNDIVSENEVVKLLRFNLDRKLSLHMGNPH